MEAANASHEETARHFGHIEPPTAAERLLVAKYWSHVDRSAP